jgi:hypothetical protein
MGRYNIVDTFPEFVDCWNQVKNRSIEEQIDRWRSDYMSKWPDLLAKQLHDYNRQGESVRDFFGSWYSIEGYPQTGYFLGNEMIKHWGNSLSVKEIALLPWGEIERRSLDYLRFGHLKAQP